MSVALLTFSKYEWLMIVVVFMTIMWFLRRIDMITELFSGMTTKVRRRGLGKRYEDDKMDYEAFKIELLGIDVELGELREKLQEINRGIFKGEVKQVSYLELWILINLYSKKVVKSDSNIYFLHKEDYIHELDIKNRDLVNWINMLKNDKMIRERQVEANFLLHKIRTGQLNGKTENESQNYISSIVFDSSYFFATREGFIREVQGENPLNIKIKIIDEYAVNDDYTQDGKEKVAALPEEVGEEIADEVIGKTENVEIGKKEAPKKKDFKNPVGANTKEDKKMEVPKDKINSQKKSRDEEFLEKAKKVTTGAKGELLVTKENGNTIKFNSKIDEIGKKEEELEVTVAEEVTVLPKQNVIGSDDATKKRFEKEMDQAKEEEVDELLNLFQVGTRNKKNKPKNTSEHNTNKKTQPRQKNKPQQQVQKRTEKKKEIEVKKREKLPFKEFIKAMKDDKEFINDFLSEEENIIFFDETTQKYYLSATHILKYLYSNITDQTVFINEIFNGSSLNTTLEDEIYASLKKSINLNSREEEDIFSFAEQTSKVFQKKNEGKLVQFGLINFLPNEFMMNKEEDIIIGRILEANNNNKKKLSEKCLKLKFTGR